MQFKYELGQKAQDIVSGLKGIIVSRAEHLTGCNTYWFNTGLGKDGKPMDGCWVDENRVKIIGTGVKIEISPNPKKNGASILGAPKNA